MEDRPTENLDFLPPPEVPDAETVPCLIALSGPEKGATFPLDPGVLVLGRSGEQADLVLSGPGISRAHAQLIVRGDGAVEMRDLGSTNGTFVNGERVAEYVLSVGDTLTLGPQVSLRLELHGKAVQELYRDMYRGATRDALTGILNRRSFMERLAEEHAASRRHGVESTLAIVDVDHFKSVNDTWGHPAGDAVLVRLATLLAEAVRTEDVVGRLGGEEFILLLRHAPLEGGHQMIDRVRESVAEQPFPIPTPEGEREIRVTISAGAARLLSSHTPEEAIESADQALYEAKRSGRNRVCKA